MPGPAETSAWESPSLHPRESSSSYPGGGGQGGWLPVESLSFPELRDSECKCRPSGISPEELLRKTGGMFHGSWTPFLRASVWVRDLEGGGRSLRRKQETPWGAARVSLRGLFCFLVAVVGGGRFLKYPLPQALTSLPRSDVMGPRWSADGVLFPAD